MVHLTYSILSIYIAALASSAPAPHPSIHLSQVRAVALSESFTLNPFSATDSHTDSQSSVDFTIAKGAYSALGTGPPGGSTTCTASWPTVSPPPACWTACSDVDYLFRVTNYEGTGKLSLNVMHDCGEDSTKMVGHVDVVTGSGGYVCSGGEQMDHCDVSGGQGITAAYRQVDEEATPKC